MHNVVKLNRVPQEHTVNNVLPVNGIGNSLTDIRIIHGRFIYIKSDKVNGRAGISNQPQIFVRGDIGQFRPGRILAEIQFAGLNGNQTGRIL